jgi:hypothetical protein
MILHQTSLPLLTHPPTYPPDRSPACPQTEIEALRLARAEALDDIANTMRVELEIEGKTFKWTDAPLEVMNSQSYPGSTPPLVLP